jgi:hypothetical protein
MGLFDGLLDLPIVGDVAGAIVGGLTGRSNQNDAQAHDAHMFIQQVAHDKEMFELEKSSAKEFASDQFERQKQLLMQSPKLQMEGLKSAGLNPILAATGGFKSPAGGGLSIPVPRASSSAKGSSGGGIAQGAQLRVGQTKLLTQQANAQEAQAEMFKAQADKARKETEYVGTKTDIAEPVAMLMSAIAGMLEQSNIDRKTSERVWEWIMSETLNVTKPLTKEQQAEMLQKAKQKFPQLKGVDNAKRKIFGGQ